MRLSLWSIIVFSSQISCGALTQRQHIENSTVSSTQWTHDDSSPFHSFNGWQTSINFFISNNAPDRIVESTISASAEWNDAVGYSLLVFEGIIEGERGESLYSSLDDEKTVIYYENNWLQTTTKPETTLATTVWENQPGSDQIVRGDIILNAENYLYQDSVEPPLDESMKNYIVDSETVLIHEFGHLLGLNHVTEEQDPDSVMHARTFIGPYMYDRALSGQDQENIRSIYPANRE